MSHHRNGSESGKLLRRLGPVDVLILSVSCGLAAGELEVGGRVAAKTFSSTNQLFLMTRHFVWLVPLVDLLMFLGFGILLATSTRLWPRVGGWLSPRLILTWAVLPVLVEVGRQIHIEAWLMLAIGIAGSIAPVVERRFDGCRGWLLRSILILLGMVLLQASWIVITDRVKLWRETNRPLPPTTAPNVLLVVLDTVRADHLSAYGYGRPTSPTMDRLAARGIRFAQARAAAPWTLASHANMFTGRWPHELGSNWLQPLRGGIPTLAEHMASLGYGTAGFVGNTYYCSYDSGLNRGFTHYDDYKLDILSALQTVHLLNLTTKTFASYAPFLSLGKRTSHQFTHGVRKTAKDVTHGFLDWLSRRQDSRRPFFGFLNYADAHAPYLLPPGEPYRLGTAPNSESAFRFLAEAWLQTDKRTISPNLQKVAMDSYDNCLSYIDKKLGELLDELEYRELLDQTLLVVVGDHGEGFGEHELFDHGESLYRPEVRVPLFVVLPKGRGQSALVVDEFVSVRDIAATITEIACPETKPHFPGRSLTRFWTTASSRFGNNIENHPVLSELGSPNPINPNQGRSPAYRGSLFSLSEGDYVYIRNEGDKSEELFDERTDPYELSNLARGDAMIPVLERFRKQLKELQR